MLPGDRPFTGRRAPPGWLWARAPTGRKARYNGTAPMPPAASTEMSRARLALIAFAFHAPGLWLLARARQNGATWRRNAVAIALTLAAMAATALETRSALGVTAVWLACHAAWGAWLARAVLAGRALQ